MLNAELSVIFTSLPFLPTSTLHDPPILKECKTLRHVVKSSAECETAVVFHNVRRATPIRYMLQQLRYPQPPTPIILDNSAIENFIKNYINKKRSKS